MSGWVCVSASLFSDALDCAGTGRFPVSCICASSSITALFCSAPAARAASSSPSHIRNRVTSRRSGKSNAGTNSFGKRTCSESSCFLVASDTLFSGLVLELALTAAWSIYDCGAASESSNCVTKWRLEGSGDTGDAIVTRNGMSAWCCVGLKMTYVGNLMD